MKRGKQKVHGNINLTEIETDKMASIAVGFETKRAVLNKVLNYYLKHHNITPIKIVDKQH